MDSNVLEVENYSNVLDVENYVMFDSNKFGEEFDCLREGEPDDEIPSTQHRGRGYVHNVVNEDKLVDNNNDINDDDNEYFIPREGYAEEVADEDDIPMSWVNIEFDIDNQEGESTH